MRNILYLCFLAFFLLGISTQAEARKKKKSGKEIAKEEKKTESLTPYQKLFEGKKVETAKGIMTVHKVDGKVYVEFPLSLQNKDMLLLSSIERTSDHGDGAVGQFGGYQIPFRFVQKDSVLLAQMDLLGRPINFSGENNMESVLENSNKGGVHMMLNVLAYTPERDAIVVDMTPLFLENSRYTTPFHPQSMNAFMGYIARQFELKSEWASIAKVRAFDRNITVTCNLDFVANGTMMGGKVGEADQPLSVTVNKMLVLLPEEPMRPRIADSRVGTSFWTKGRIKSGKHGMDNVYLTRRWRLEPVDEAAHRRGELVEVKKPIVFYVDSLMPKEWRPAIKDAFEAWNVAFERIGFKNVIRVVDFPKDNPDFDANNIEYSTIRYAPGWLTVAPTMHFDTRTGEILNASLCLFDGFFSMQKTMEILFTSGADPNIRKNQFSQEEINDMLRGALMQVAGINLGLETNLKASSAYPTDSLRSPSFTRKYGLSPSVMDNLPFNYVAQPEDVRRGVCMSQKRLGECDFYTIKWLYQPIPEATSFEDEVDVLDRWIREGRRNPYLKFGHLMSQFYDPSSNAQDLGDDPLKTTRYFFENMKRLTGGFMDWFGEDDADYAKRTLYYKNMVQVCQQRLMALATNLGGVYQENTYATEDIPSFSVVPRERQKAIVRYFLDLEKNLSWLSNERIERELEVSNPAKYEVANRILPTLFGRLNAIAFTAEKGSEYTVEECMDDIYRDVWEGTLKNRKLTSTEMLRQKQFLVIVNDASTVQGGFMAAAPMAFAGEKPEILQGKNPLMNMTDLQTFVYRHGTQPFSLSTETGSCDFRVLPHGVAKKEAMPAERYFAMLFRVQDLLKDAVVKSSGDTKMHYEYLLYKIKNALDKTK